MSQEYAKARPSEEASLEEFSVEELKKYNGIQEERILLAVNGKVYDVSAGKEFYGKGGAYAELAGRDATRGLCLFEVVASDEPVDLSAMTQCEKESLQHWEEFYAEKYPQVGTLKRSS